MTLSKQFLLGVAITTTSKKQLLSFCSSVFSKQSMKNSPISIVTPNAEQIVLAGENKEFRTILNEASIALPDGIGVVWGLKMVSKGHDIKTVTRISGVDFVVDLCQLAASHHVRVFLYGGRRGVAEMALSELKRQIPGLNGLAEDGEELTMPIANPIAHGYMITNAKETTEHIVQVIRSRNCKIVFIGLGAPKQEYLIAALKKRLEKNSVIFMAVGGAFDMLAGKIKRAPKFVQTIGFEWLWRLIKEPWRWQRQLALINFIKLVLLQKIRDN